MSFLSSLDRLFRGSARPAVPPPSPEFGYSLSVDGHKAEIVSPGDGLFALRVDGIACPAGTDRGGKSYIEQNIDGVTFSLMQSNPTVFGWPEELGPTPAHDPVMPGPALYVQSASADGSELEACIEAYPGDAPVCPLRATDSRWRIGMSISRLSNPRAARIRKIPATPTPATSRPTL